MLFALSDALRRMTGRAGVTADVTTDICGYTATTASFSKRTLRGFVSADPPKMRTSASCCGSSATAMWPERGSVGRASDNVATSCTRTEDHRSAAEVLKQPVRHCV